MTSPSGEIEFCWEGPHSDEATALIAEIESYLFQQLTLRASLPIKFDSDCFKKSDPFSPVGLAFYDDPLVLAGIKNEIAGLTVDPNSPGHPYTFNRGRWTATQLTDVNLTSQFGAVNDQLRAQAVGLSENGKLNLKISIALHEVMHSLGYAHEQAHRDSLCIVPNENFKPHVHELLTAYDPDSVMNYCLTHHFDFESSAIPLSDLDIEGIRMIYEGKYSRTRRGAPDPGK